jgi:REP element-mobilizing transposase RayT
MPSVARSFLSSLDEARPKVEIDIYAFVLMPEHSHILGNPRNEVYEISALVQFES